VDAYKANAAYKQDKTLIDRISGRSDSAQGISTEVQDEIFRREGITEENEKDRIVLWEMYTPGKDGWLVETYSPLAVETDVRPKFTLPYEHGEPCFVDFPYEITGGGWYSPRGVAEILLPSENLLNKLKNSLADYVELANRPVFEAQNPISLNTANLKMVPGQILPQGLKPVQFQQPPFDFQKLMLEERLLAEQRMGNPDFGVGSQFQVADRKTATEIAAIQGQAAASGDLRNRIFRMSLARLFKQAWRLYVQYNKEDLFYRYADETGQMVPDGIHDQYSIEPKGGLDFINRQFALQKAVARYQMMQGNPFINQGELVKSILEQDDPSLVRRLFQDPQAGSGDQAEDQANEIATMLATGFPVNVKPADDHKVHISVLFAFQQAAQLRQQPLDPSAVQVLLQHLQQHLAALEQTDPNTSRAIQKQLRDAAKADATAQPQQGQPLPAEAAPVPAEMVPAMRDAVQERGLNHLCVWANQKGAKGKAVEIGAYGGEGTVVFAKYFKEVVSIDPWLNGYDKDDVASHQAPMKWVFNAWRDRTKDLDHVRCIRTTSKDAIVYFEDESLDFVYVDGDHRY